MRLIILILISFSVIFTYLGQLSLIDPDEGRYAESAREMIGSSNYIIPHLNGEPRINKPVLFYWLIAASYKVFGLNEFAARFFSALFGFALIIGFYFFIRKELGRSKSYIAWIMLLSSPAFFIISKIAITDMVFTAFVVTALLSFWHLYKYNRFHIMPFLFLGLSLSVKGPSGAILIFISLAVFSILIKNTRPLKVFFNPLGVLIVLTAGGFWYLLLIFEIGWAEFLVLLHRETLGRFQEGFVHREPFYYYVPVIAAGFLPWSLLLFGVKKSEFRHDFTKFMAVYAVVVFLFFSLCKSKLPTYVLSIFPALSVIASGSVQRLWSNRTKIPLIFFIILIAVALVLIYLPLDSMSNISGISFSRIALIIFLTAFPLLLISGLKFKYQFFYIAMVPFLIYFALVRSYGHEFSDYRSAKNLFIRQQVKTGRVYSWRFFQPSLAFYSRSIVDVINSSQELKDGYLVVRKKDLADVKSNLFNFFEISQTQKYILFEVQKLQNCNIIKDS